MDNYSSLPPLYTDTLLEEITKKNNIQPTWLWYTADPLIFNIFHFYIFKRKQKTTHKFLRVHKNRMKSQSMQVQ